MLTVAILAGGLATRLRPSTETIPKALIEINGEPFLAHQLRLLQRSGISRAVLCVGYRGEQIQEYASDGSRFGLRINYVFDGPQLLGTAGAIRGALPLLGDAFFILYGDSYLPCDYRAIEDTFVSSEKLGLMTVFRNEGKFDQSNVEFSGDRILVYDKVMRTPAMRHIDYGLGVMRKAVFERLPPGRPCELAGVYQDLLRQGELAAYEVPDRFYEIGSFDGIRELEELLKAPKQRAVFLDRDGVLNEAIVREGRPYPPASLEDLKIFPEAADSLAYLKQAGFLLIVVTNQPDVARGTQKRRIVETMNAVIRAALPIDEFLTCWHDDSTDCDCRKPRPGLIRDAAAKHRIDLAQSFMIGDRWRDIDAGAAAGCRTVLIDRHYCEREPQHPPDLRTTSLTSAVQWILAHAEQAASLNEGGAAE